MLESKFLKYELMNLLTFRFRRNWYFSFMLLWTQIKINHSQLPTAVILRWLKNEVYYMVSLPQCNINEGLVNYENCVCMLLIYSRSKHSNIYLVPKICTARYMKIICSTNPSFYIWKTRLVQRSTKPEWFIGQFYHRKTMIFI